MKLIEALELNRQPWPDDPSPVRVNLVCGFTPLHLATFLLAYLRQACPNRRIEIETGLFGDSLNTLEKLESSQIGNCAVVLEWTDLDPRLGLRSLGGWGPGVMEDILATVNQRITRIAASLTRISQEASVAVCLPSLPLPPIAYTPGWRTSRFEISVKHCLDIIENLEGPGPRIRIINPQRLAELSPLVARFDVKAELVSGFPYRMPHAAAVAQLLACAVFPPAPKKGLITDLDDTVWCGLVGEIGPDAVSWNLDNRSQVHGLYQQVLQGLAETGVLIAVASKNDPAPVEEALARTDLILRPDRIFPKEVSWRRKPDSVRKILNTWNVGADSVVFIDDSPAEVGEVQQAFPDMKCILFPKRDPQAVYELLWQLRDMFGKERISEEDSLRLNSIRRATVAIAQSEANGDSVDDFLQQVDAEITISFAKYPRDERAYELLNKTNQFNLNGRRYNESAWEAYLKRSDTFVMVASYQDKFGQLGKVSVVAGHRQNGSVVLDSWVMSCRAFSRQIEHQCLQALFDRFKVDEIAFRFEPTPKNKPIKNLLTTVLNEEPVCGARLDRNTFLQRAPRLFHEVKIVADDQHAISAN